MTRHFENPASVQAQLNELKELKDRVKILEDEMKSYMNDNDIDVLKGEITCYTRTWVNDSYIFDTTKFKKENANLYEQYKTKEKAGTYRFEVKVIK